MARKSSIRYYASRGGYYTCLAGRQVLLATGPDDSPQGPTFAAARARFIEVTFGPQDAQTFASVAAAYLEWCADHREPATLKMRRYALLPFADSLGGAAYSKLTAYTVESFADGKRRDGAWSDSTARIFLSSVSACLRWATKKGVIPSNPVGPLELPQAGRRGVECVLTPEQRDLVISKCSRAPLRRFVQALRDTGARPGEIAMAHAHHFAPELRALVFPALPRRGDKKHKTARTGKPRVVYLSGETADTVPRLVERYPSGPLFRSSSPRLTGPHKGECWQWTSNGVASAFELLREKTGIRSLIAYSFRHSFAVDWLQSGRSADVLCEVLGTSLKMLRDHYSHLADQTEYLRRIVDEFAQRQGG